MKKMTENSEAIFVIPVSSALTYGSNAELNLCSTEFSFFESFKSLSDKRTPPLNQWKAPIVNLAIK